VPFTTANIAFGRNQYGHQRSSRLAGRGSWSLSHVGDGGPVAGQSESGGELRATLRPKRSEDAPVRFT
jgi:hypothetical protein